VPVAASPILVLLAPAVLLPLPPVVLLTATRAAAPVRPLAAVPRVQLLPEVA
jgi:hypothetical protein